MTIKINFFLAIVEVMDPWNDIYSASNCREMFLSRSLLNLKKSPAKKQESSRKYFTNESKCIFWNEELQF